MDGLKYIFTAVLLLLGQSALAQSSYSEETGALESIYESRARAALNTMLRPQEYTLVISAELEKDERKMKEYQERLEMENLPGLPMPGDSALQAATNSLHEMKSRITVNLVLAPEVPAEKEVVLKTILKNKLHLDEGNGDIISIARAPFPQDPKPESPPPAIFPELTWKTWALILILALVCLAGLMYYVSKRSQRKAEEEELNKAATNSRPTPYGQEFIPTPSPAAEKNKSDSESEGPQKPQVSEEELEHERDCILGLATQYPQICSKIASSMIERNMEKPLIIAFENLGWDLSKKLMSEIPPRIWARIGQKIRNHSGKPSPEELLKALSEVHKELLSGVLESGAMNDEKNPFAFLSKATRAERLEILKGESATNIAVLSFFLSAEDMRDVFESMDPDTQSQITSAMTRLQSLPDTIIKKISGSLLTKLTQYRKEPITSVDGAFMAGRTLRAMSPEKEAEVFANLMENQPSEAEQIRKNYLQFMDLPLFPKDAVALALSESDVGDVVKAMLDQKPDFVDSLLRLMPPKRANMVRRDMESPALRVNQADQWAARRMLVLKVEDYFRQQGFSIKTVWDFIDQESATSRKVA